MRKNKILPLILSLFLLLGLVSATTTFSGLSPDDNWDTSDTTPRFCGTPSTNESTITNVVLFVNGTDTGNITSGLSNNTQFCITSSELNKAIYTWYFNVTDAGSVSQSTERTLTISYFGSVVQTLQDMVGFFAPILAIVIAIVPIIIIIALLGFILALFSSIFGTVEGKIKKGI